MGPVCLGGRDPAVRSIQQESRKYGTSLSLFFLSLSSALLLAQPWAWQVLTTFSIMEAPVTRSPKAFRTLLAVLNAITGLATLYGS